MIQELNTEEYQGDFNEGMRNVTGLNNSGVDIWPYVQELVEEKIVSAEIAEKQQVEIVYQNDSNTLHHVLLPHDKENIFIVVLVNLQQQTIAGHYRLDLNEVYGLE